jgi:hypothetical protein
MNEIQIFINLSFFVAILVLAFAVKFLLHEMVNLKKENLHDFIEHKGDAKNLEAQIKSIDSNIWIDGRRPTPIRPVPVQLLDEARK